MVNIILDIIDLVAKKTEDIHKDLLMMHIDNREVWGSFTGNVVKSN